MTDPTPAPPRVFLSYSHDSADHAKRVLALADQLRHDGVDAWLDQYAPHQDHWPQWMLDQIERADVVLAICTATYRERFEGRANSGSKGTRWEGAILTGDLYHQRGRQVIPILFGGDTDQLPNVLENATRIDLEHTDGYETLYRRLTDQPAVDAPPLGPCKALAPQPLLSTFGLALAPSTPEPVDTEPIEQYRRWAAEHYARLDLMGLGAGEIQVDLDRIYIPLRVGPTAGIDRSAELADGLSEGRPYGYHETLELDRLFLTGQSRHALLFGEPGSGKTTALRKLHQLLFDQGPEALGLAPGTLPIFLRLRRWTPRLLSDQTLADFLEAELREIAGARIPEGLGDALWRRGRLLLLLDGLDEIADEPHRAKVLQRLAWCLDAPEAADIRAVVSTRLSGWTDAVQKVDVSAFLEAQVRPFDDDQIRTLVDLWFREMVRREELAEAAAADRVATLSQALDEAHNQQFKVLISTPMLLTLLCIVVVRGGEIPRRRVEFYEECLKVLCGRWRRRRSSQDSPVEPEQALALVGELAWHLHSRQRRDDLRWAEAVQILKSLLGSRPLAFQVIDWLYRDAGVLDRYSDKYYGFAHLGFQEHATVRHLAAHPALLDELPETWWDDSWWDEVIELLATLPDSRGFEALMRCLLDSEAIHCRADLLATCLRDATTRDWSPFVDALADSTDEARLAILRLLHGFVRGQETPTLSSTLKTQVRALAHQGSDPVRLAASPILDALAVDAAESTTTVYLLHGPEDTVAAGRLAKQLDRRGFVTGRPTDRPWYDARTIQEFAGVPMVLVLVGDAVFDPEELQETLDIFDEATHHTVLLPGEPRPTSPLTAVSSSDLTAFTDEALDKLSESLRRRTGWSISTRVTSTSASSIVASAKVIRGRSVRPEIGDEYHEPATGEVFLGVPGGRFQMGTNEGHEHERPVHWVKLSPFWLARTPVTNRQYGLFLEARDHQEPLTWRDRRFSDPAQPVVNVSWNDAIAYCNWLTEVSPTGGTFQLPTESQWEFAARGSNGRTYPWGAGRPDSSRACFARSRSTGRPSACGSFIAGAGPFGHLDLAGGVWEWCADLWELSYARWAKEEPTDPVGKSGDSTRPLRGGGWGDPMSILRSAFRRGDSPRIRDVDIGFRVLCVPPS